MVNLPAIQQRIQQLRESCIRAGELAELRERQRQQFEIDQLQEQCRAATFGHLPGQITRNRCCICDAHVEHQATVLALNLSKA